MKKINLNNYSLIQLWLNELIEASENEQIYVNEFRHDWGDNMNFSAMVSYIKVLNTLNIMYVHKVHKKDNAIIGIFSEKLSPTKAYEIRTLKEILIENPHYVEGFF